MANISVYSNPAVTQCMAADPSAGQALCGEPPRFYPFVRTPLFVSENTADSYQVFVQGGCPQSKDAGPVSFVQYVRGIIGDSLHEKVVAGSKAKTDGLFAPACLAHCLAWNGDNAPTIKGKTHQQAMGDWYFGRGLKTHMLINDDESIDTLLSCTDVTSELNATKMKHQHY